MSDLLQDIQVDLFLPGLKTSNRTQLFQILTKEIAAKTANGADDLFAQLSEREQNVSSAIGEGAALAHLQLKYLYKPFKVLAVLQQSIDFEAPDMRPVDLVCLVLSPTQDGNVHLRRMARMARILKNPEFRRKVSQARDLNCLKELMSATESWMLAA